MRLHGRWIAVVALLTCAHASVGADENGAWRAAYRDGSKRFDLGDFQGALDSFKRAYLAHDEPGILFDIGECHRLLGHNADAVHAYRSYLRKKPDAANRAAVEATIASLESGGAAKPTAAAPSHAAAPTPAAEMPAAAPAAAAPVAPSSAPSAASGSVYNPWGASMPAAAPAPSPPPTPQAMEPAPAPAAPTAAAPDLTPPPTAATSAPPPALTAVEAAPPPRKKSKAWIAAVVVPCAVVLAVTIGVSAWYASPSPKYTDLGAVQ